MSTPPTVVFDLDGTLADTIHDIVPTLNRTIAKRNLAPVTTQQVGHICAQGARAMIEWTFQQNNLPVEKDEIDELMAYFLVDYGENIALHTKIYPGVEICLEKFSGNGWQLAVCTNKTALLAEKLLHELDLHSKFAAITGRDSFDFLKPDPRHLIETISLAGGSTSNAVMVGDTQTDILTAQNAKVPVVAVDFGYSRYPVTRYAPDRVIARYDELFDIAASLIGEN